MARKPLLPGMTDEAYLRGVVRGLILEEMAGTKPGDDGEEEAIAFAKERAARMKRARAEVTGPRPSLVYFIQGVGGGPIKIGHTADLVERRLSDLQVGSPVKLRVVAVAPGGRSLELRLHRQLAAHRLHGEWFSDVEEVRAAIAKVRG